MSASAVSTTPWNGPDIGPMTLREKLLRLMNENRIKSQRDLALTLDVPKSTVNRWVSGKGKPDLTEGLKLSRLFKVSLEYLADDEMDSQPTPLLTEEEVKKLDLVEDYSFRDLKRVLLRIGVPDNQEVSRDLQPSPPPEVFHKAGLAITRGGRRPKGDDNPAPKKGKPVGGK